MAIYKLLQNTVLGPEEIKRLTDAYELTLKAYSLKDRSDPLTQAHPQKKDIGDRPDRDRRLGRAFKARHNAARHHVASSHLSSPHWWHLYNHTVFPFRESRKFSAITNNAPQVGQRR
jgi:hypothetical protein